MSVSERELLADIVAALDDDDPRLVYADWLIDRSDPRGELIIAQCALDRANRGDRPLAETQPLHDTARTLIDTHGSGWLDPLFAITAGYYEYRRGMVEHVELMQATIDAERLRELAPTLRSVSATHDVAHAVFAAAAVLPIDAIRLAGVSEVAVIRRGCEAVPALRCLELTRAMTADPGLVPAGNGLAHVRLELVTRSDGQQLLVRLAGAGRLRSLALRNLEIVDPAPLADLELAALELSHVDGVPRQPALTSLTILQPPVTLDLDRLFEALPVVRHLRLLQGRLSDRLALALASSPHSARLTRLDLSHNEIGPTGARALAESEHLGGLVELRLAFNKLDDETKLYVQAASNGRSLVLV